jgi:hypothetical protein
MTPSSLVIVTDRGELKAYRVNETPTRGPSLQLVQAFNITDAHGRLVDKLSDLAGRFPVTNGAGAHHGAGSTAERTQLATEMRRPKFTGRLSIFCLSLCATESSNM